MFALCDNTIYDNRSAGIADRDVDASMLDAIASKIIFECCPSGYLLLYSLLLATVVARVMQKA